MAARIALVGTFLVGSLHVIFASSGVGIVSAQGFPGTPSSGEKVYSRNNSSS